MKRIVIKHLQPKDVILLHNLMIDATGGTHGISNYQEFEAAVQTPDATFVGQEMYPTVIEKAAALLHALITRPVFIDSKGQKADVNQKTAILSCMTFLEINGYEFIAEPKEVVKFIKSAENENLTVDQTIEWVVKNCRKV
jgi:death on curing protein